MDVCTGSSGPTGGSEWICRFPSRWASTTAIVAMVLAVAAALAPERDGAREQPPAPHAAGRAPPVHCDLFASPSGSDSSGDGSLGSPFASLNKLDAVLRPGETGCLRAGSYGSTSTWHQIDTDGTARGQITITSYPGETATVRGYVDIEGSYTTLSHLSIDGSNTFYKQVREGTNCPAPVSQPLVIAGHERRARVRRLLPVGRATARQRDRDRVLGRRRQHDHPLLARSTTSASARRTTI